MASFNKIILAGNLTREPEMRYTPKGTPIAKIGLAVNRTWKDADGNKKESVLFVDCKAFGKTAETLSQYVKKGHPILIEGRLDLEEWTDKESNEKRRRHLVAIEGFQFLAPGDRKAGGKGSPASLDGSGPTEPMEGDDVAF